MRRKRTKSRVHLIEPTAEKPGAPKGIATLKAILEKNGRLAKRIHQEIDARNRFDLLKAEGKLPPGHTRAFRSLKRNADRAEQFCLGVAENLIRGIRDPRWLEIYGDERVEHFDRNHGTSREKAPTAQAQDILNQAALLISDKKVHDYPSLRRKLGTLFKNTDVSASSITKVLGDHAERFGPQFAPRPRTSNTT